MLRGSGPPGFHLKDRENLRIFSIFPKHSQPHYYIFALSLLELPSYALYSFKVILHKKLQTSPTC